MPSNLISDVENNIPLLLSTIWLTAWCKDVKTSRWMYPPIPIFTFPIMFKACINDIAYLTMKLNVLQSCQFWLLAHFWIVINIQLRCHGYYCARKNYASRSIFLSHYLTECSSQVSVHLNRNADNCNWSVSGRTNKLQLLGAAIIS